MRQFILSCIVLCFACLCLHAIEPVVLMEEDIIDVKPPGNGAGPLWCYGSPLIVRDGERVFASIPETGAEVPLLCNTRWRLFERTGKGWVIRHQAEPYREREPSPLVRLAGGTLVLSANPSTEPPGVKYGACEPQLLFFSLPQLEEPRSIKPTWDGQPHFTDHSYRGIAADAKNGELLLFHIDAKTSEQNWSFRAANGEWIAKGKLSFPLRSCYPQVFLKDRAAHIMAIGDIVEPVESWRQYKRKKTGRKWDYVFRRLFYSYTPDIVNEPFCEAMEVLNLDATAGHITNLDLWVNEEGVAALLFIKQQVQNELMRDRFFPTLRYSLARHLEVAFYREGKHIQTNCYAVGGDGHNGETLTPQPQYARFHVTPDGWLYIVSCDIVWDAEGKARTVNRIRRIRPKSKDREKWVEIPLQEPFRQFFTNTVRGGSQPSRTLDLYGIGNNSRTLRYACILLE
ncbi:hypothetical protein GF373_03125 [bacterium]|nr:hypothetical protein [bacterium]